MHSITSVGALHQAIVVLEIQRREQEQGLVNHFTLILDGLKPVNLIKNIVRDIAGAPNIHHHILNTAIGMATGYLSRKFFINSQSGPLKKIFGAALQLGVTGLIRKKGDAIKAGGFRLLRRLLVNHNENGSR